MRVSRWWRAFLTTFDLNHNQKRGKSLILKALCIRNLFHQDRRRRENSIVTFWGEWGKTSSANAQTIGATTPGSWIVTMLRLTHRLLCSSFSLLRIQQSSPPPSLLTGHHPLWFFLFPKMKLQLKGRHWQCWRDPDWTAECNGDADTKWLPDVLPIMEILLELLYQCQRELLQRGWGK